jgi:hypothetical protein
MALVITRTAFPELGEGGIPVFIDAITINIPAATMHVIRTISNINIMSRR